LRELLPNEPTIYLPHPGQRLDLVPHLPQPVNLGDQTHHWNELACYFIKPRTVYSVFSTAAFTLRRIFGLPFECKFMFDKFHERTGHPSFVISESMRAYFEGLC
jgi:hypothetical protein